MLQGGSILQYFRPSLSYHLPIRYLFCLFLSGRLTQVLLYKYNFHGMWPNPYDCMIKIAILPNSVPFTLWCRLEWDKPDVALFTKQWYSKVESSNVSKMPRQTVRTQKIKKKSLDKQQTQKRLQLCCSG